MCKSGRSAWRRKALSVIQIHLLRGNEGTTDIVFIGLEEGCLAWVSTSTTERSPECKGGVSPTVAGNPTQPGKLKLDPVLRSLTWPETGKLGSKWVQKSKSA